MADLARFSALFIILCSSPGILREPPFFVRERETFWYLFCPCTPYGSGVSFTGEEEEEEEGKKMTIFNFFKIRFLGFYKAELKSDDIFVIRRVRAFSGYSFCWLNPQTTCLFTLAYCTVKTYQPPSSLHRDCYCNL